MTAPPEVLGQPLAGRSIVTTRPEAGAVDAALTALGAQVFHVPLIEIVDADPASLEELAHLISGPPAAEATPPGTTYLVVTSAAGARRVGTLAARSTLRLGAVGTATAATLAGLAGRPVDIVPERQTAADLVGIFPAAQPGDRVVVAQADRAASTLVDGLRDRGYDVQAVTAYRTQLRVPNEADIATALSADAVVFASGSAVEAWVAALGVRTPHHVIVIGPTTAEVAVKLGVQVSVVATEHSVDGLVAATVAALT